MRHGRRSSPTVLNLGMRRLVGVEPEVDKSYTQTSSERSNLLVNRQLFDLSEDVFVIGYLSASSATPLAVKHGWTAPPPVVHIIS